MSRKRQKLENVEQIKKKYAKNNSEKRFRKVIKMLDKVIDVILSSGNSFKNDDVDFRHLGHLMTKPTK